MKMRLVAALALFASPAPHRKAACYLNLPWAFNSAMRLAHHPRR